MNAKFSVSRRAFLRNAALTGAVAATWNLAPSSAMTESRKGPTWIEHTLRWGQLTLVEDDPGKFDPQFWLDYGMAPRTRTERADVFSYKHQRWLAGLPPRTAATVQALAAQFSRGGTEGLENPNVFQTPEVVAAGGLKALKIVGSPGDLLRETKQRMFAA